MALTLITTGALAQGSQAGMTDEEKIADAMSAGPDSITTDATILEWPSEPGGEFTVLREGTNGWSCIVSSPVAMSADLQDPACEDETWFAWDKAWLAGEEPVIDEVGISYMLSGDAGASNTDPFATGPTDDNAWHVSGPHVMVLLPGLDYEGISTDPHNGGAYVMFAGTPYAHIMVPVEPHVGEQQGQAEGTPSPCSYLPELYPAPSPVCFSEE